jgi:TetR/AcrR family fatty acid metabolism transcriptional regulator
MTENKKDRIIKAAMQVFAKHGYERGTVSEIAKLANIAKGSFYQYYGSKEEIIYDLFDMVFSKFMSSWKKIVGSDATPEEKVELLIDQTFKDLNNILEEENVTTMILIFEIMFMLFRKSINDRDNNEIEEFFRQYYDILIPVFKKGKEQGYFREDLDPKYLAYLIFSMVDGFGIHFLIQKDNYNVDKTKKYFKDILLNGILKKEEA